MNIKTIRMIGMGGIAIAMIAWMGYDFLSQPTTPPISSDVPTEIYVEPADAQPLEETSLTPEESIPPLAEIIDQQTQARQTTNTVSSNASVSELIAAENAAMIASTEVPSPMVTFTLSNRAQKVLDALEETYISQVTDAKLTAQIAARTRQDELDKLTEKEEVTIVTSFDTSKSTIDLLTVKSIVSTPKRITAWIELNGQTVPIQRGAWIDDVRALNITKDFVRFVNKQGKEFTKYVDTALPILSEKDDDK
ncbi:hypothetical protein [Vibrio harveyi]|uniref:hypothetical protein n=1 Tax=Vibrio harveyi TaxID=669 RepID=UPI0002DD5D74|nr:hypothetical protein [Vibrio harveyi]